MAKQRFACFKSYLLLMSVLGICIAPSCAQALTAGGASHKTPANGQGTDKIPNLVQSLVPNPTGQAEVVLPGSRPYSQFAPYYTVADGFMTMLMLNNGTQAGYSVKV